MIPRGNIKEENTSIPILYDIRSLNGPCLVMVAQERGLPQRKLGDKQNGSISFSFSCFPFDEIENPNKLKGLGFLRDLYWY